MNLWRSFSHNWKILKNVESAYILIRQVIAYGLILHDESFCRSSFNLLDLLVVTVSLVSAFIA